MATTAPALGDQFTIAGIYQRVPNPNRRWWQLWKPRTVVTDRLRVFRVSHVV